MKNFVRWVKAVARWLRQVPITYHYGVALALVAASVAVVGALGWTEQAIRIAGTVLQVGGVLTVVWGILQTRAAFGQTKIWTQFKQWIKVFPRLHPCPETNVLEGAFLPPTGGAFGGHALHVGAPDQSVEGRLGHLEKTVRDLSSSLGKAQANIAQAQMAAERALEEKARQLLTQIAEVEKKIETTATGGFHVSAVGVVLVFFGTLFGGAALELHKLMTP